MDLKILFKPHEGICEGAAGFCILNCKATRRDSCGSGVAGAAYSAGSLGYDIVSGQEVTAGQVFDTAVSEGLSLIAISNPVTQSVQYKYPMKSSANVSRLCGIF